MIATKICTHDYHDKVINTQVYSPLNCAGPRVPLFWAHPSDRTDASPLSCGAALPPPFGGGCNRVKNNSIINPALPTWPPPSTTPFLGYCAFQGLPSAPPTDPADILGPGTVATMGNSYRGRPGPPVLRSILIHLLIRAGAPSTHYLPLLVVPGPFSGTRSVVPALPICSDSSDRSRLAPVGWLGWGQPEKFWCIYSPYFCCYPQQTPKLTDSQVSGL